MIYPTGRASGPWIRGPQRTYPRLLDPLFMADFLAQDPHTEVKTFNGKQQTVVRWLNGVQFIDLNMGETDGEPVPAKPDVREIGETDAKPATPLNDDELFCYPFELTTSTELGVPGLGEREGFSEARHRAILENWLGWAFGQALIEHPTATVTSPEGVLTPLSLANIPMRQVSTNVPLIEALVAVDAALCDLLGDEQGMVLMSPTAYSWLLAWGGVQLDGPTGRPLTPNGHYIVAEVGFDGLRGPEGEPTAAGKDWIVGTPIIQWFHTDLYSPGDKQPEQFQGSAMPTALFNSTTNKMLGIDELWGILVMRPAAVAAFGVYPTGA